MHEMQMPPFSWCPNPDTVIHTVEARKSMFNQGCAGWARGQTHPSSTRCVCARNRAVWGIFWRPLPGHSRCRARRLRRVKGWRGSGGGGGRGGHGWGGSSGDWNWGRPVFLTVCAIIHNRSKPCLAESRERSEPLDAKTVSVIMPVLNEELCIQEAIRYLTSLQDPPLEIIVVDAGSVDNTVKLAKKEGAKVIRGPRGRAPQMNKGSDHAKGEYFCFLHADTQPPQDFVAIINRELTNRHVVLGGFLLSVELPDRKLHLSNLNSLLKTWYIPILFRPLSFARGLRMLFGDQCLFCRASDFQRVGGYNDDLPIMEDADLCMKLHENEALRQLNGKKGHVKLVMDRTAKTSGRRIANWGNAKAMMIYTIIVFNWYFGASPKKIHELYNRLYTDNYR